MCVLENMPERIPKSGTFELTVRCNLRCKMCLFRQNDSKNNWLKRNEKTAKEWIDMAKQVAEAGTLELLLTGGEVMLRPDFCEIYEEIYKLGFVIQLYTNATLVNDRIIETLKKYPPHKIGVTLYGASPETYKKVCGNSDAFDRAIDGIKRLNQLPSVLEIRTTLIKDNVQDIDKIEEIARQIVSPGAKVIHSEYVLKAVRGGDCDVENCRLTPKENLDLMFRRSDKRINQFFKEKNIDTPKYKYVLQDNSDELKNKRITLLGCDAGMSSYTISWDGKLLGCQIFGSFFTEPFRDGFVDAWRKYPFAAGNFKQKEECNDCSCKRYCFTCCAIDYAETNSLNKCPKYFCEMAKELKKLVSN